MSGLTPAFLFFFCFTLIDEAQGCNETKHNRYNNDEKIGAIAYHLIEHKLTRLRMAKVKGYGPSAKYGREFFTFSGPQTVVTDPAGDQADEMIGFFLVQRPCFPIQQLTLFIEQNHHHLVIAVA